MINNAISKSSEMTTGVRKAGISAVATFAMAAVLALPAIAQSTSNVSAASIAQTADMPSATGKPLQTQSNEGFWGHLNPMARKKWVNRQVNPVKDRLNELDQLSAKNAADIKDFDARAQAGIQKAQTTAEAANSQTMRASSTALQAQEIALKANAQTGQLNSTVANLDQYTPMTDTEIHFRPGQTVLNAKAKDALDQIASQLQGQRGYIVEVQGYSSARGSAGINASQSLSNAVVRYLVVDHQIPVYRIHLIALGNAPMATSTDATAARLRGSLVHVTLMQNSLATLGVPASAVSPIGATQNTQPVPQQ